jgi:hypothetical protein
MEYQDRAYVSIRHFRHVPTGEAHRYRANGVSGHMYNSTFMLPTKPPGVCGDVNWPVPEMCPPLYLLYWYKSTNTDRAVLEVCPPTLLALLAPTFLALLIQKYKY